MLSLQDYSSDSSREPSFDFGHDNLRQPSHNGSAPASTHPLAQNPMDRPGALPQFGGPPPPAGRGDRVEHGQYPHVPAGSALRSNYTPNYTPYRPADTGATPRRPRAALTHTAGRTPRPVDGQLVASQYRAAGEEVYPPPPRVDTASTTTKQSDHTGGGHKWWK